MGRLQTAPEKRAYFAQIKGQEVPIKLRVNRRAKRLIIKPDPLSQSIILTCPTKKSIKEGLTFIAEKQDWLAQGLAEGPRAAPFKPNSTIPLQGISHQLIHTESQRRAVIYSADTRALSIGGGREHFGRRTEDWLRKRELATQRNLPKRQGCQSGQCLPLLLPLVTELNDAFFTNMSEFLCHSELVRLVNGSR